MSGKWVSSRFGEIAADDSSKIRDVVETLFDGPQMQDDFVSYVDNEGLSSYDFVYNEGDLSSTYEDMKSNFIDAQIDEFCEGDDVYIGGEEFKWVDEPSREIAMVVKMTITDMDLDVSTRMRVLVNENFGTDEFSVEVLKDERSDSE